MGSDDTAFLRARRSRRPTIRASRRRSRGCAGRALGWARCRLYRRRAVADPQRLDWTHKYPPIAAAVSALGARQAYLDGELCGVFPDGITSFGMIQAASDAGNAAGLVYFIFRPFCILDGDDVGAQPLIERKVRLAELLSDVAPPLYHSDYHRGRGPAFHEQACKLELEGIVSKRADAPYTPGNRGLWVKVKCLHREEFVVVGWTDPEGSRPYLGALLLAYYDPEDGPRLRRPGRDWDQAGRAGTALAKAGGACYRQDAAGHATAPNQPLWVTTDIEPRALGAARACCRGQIPDLDRRQSVAPGRISGVARGQAGERGAPAYAASEAGRGG